MRNWQAQPRGGARIGKRGTVKVLIWREMTQITQCCLKITKFRTQLILLNPYLHRNFMITQGWLKIAKILTQLILTNL